MRAFILSLSIAISACVSSLAAAGDMTICNRSDERMEYAMVWDEGIPVFADIWKAAGWYHLDPGSCVTQLSSSYRQEMFLSVRYMSVDGLTLANFGVDDITCPLCDTQLLGIERFFCVSREEFERTEDDLEDHEQCPAGYYYQLFNLYAFSAATSDLTIELE